MCLCSDSKLKFPSFPQFRKIIFQPVSLLKSERQFEARLLFSWAAPVQPAEGRLVPCAVRTACGPSVPASPQS